MGSSYYGDQQNNSLKIYEFSRELLDISQKDGRWLSGGFGAEIGKSNQDVPKDIQDAVNGGDFRINDNYPPKQQEYALIAREIGEYSVLAVATRVGDDKTRILIAYRYFWLQKYDHQDIDGVGTLLIWWMNAGEPKFDFEWTPNSGTLNYTAQYYLRENYYQYFERYSEHVQDILRKIREYPFAYQFKEVESRNALHYLALHLNKEYNTPISWAWNVGWLEFPQNFTLICSDNNEKSHQYNSTGIKNYKKQLIKSPVLTSHTNHSPVPTPSENYSVGVNTRREESVPPNREEPSNARNVVKTSNTQNKSDFNQIRTSLKNIADNQNIEIEMQKLGVFLENYPSINFKDHDIIDNFNKGYSSPFKIRYTALLAILGYVSVSEWLENLNDLKNNKDKNAFLNIQRQLLDHSKKKNPNSVYIMLKNNINNDISELLLKFKQTNDPETHHDIEWLLLKSNSIWVKCFNEYAKELVVKLIRGDQQGDDLFYNALQQNNSQGYKNLAFLFQKLPNYSLSAYFYQLSEGSVPSDIYDKADAEIIPLKREANQGDNQQLTSKKILRNPYVITLAIASLFFGGVWAAISMRNGFSGNNGDRGNRIQAGGNESTKNLETSMQVYIEKKDDNLKTEIKTYLDNLKSPNKEMRNQPDYEYIDKNFIPKIKIELENVQRVNDFPEEVKKVQNILKILGYKINEIDGNLGNTSMSKYQEFQKKNKEIEQISQEDLNGKTRKSTLEALINQLTDKQVGETAKFLLTKLNKEDSQTFEESIKNLQDCSRQESYFTYINKCLK